MAVSAVNADLAVTLAVFTQADAGGPVCLFLPEFAVQDKFVVIMADNTPRLY
ncbi:Uncharacterised protein [Morganella morganii]|nr:Uncharacterised protein [Morganella morganii]